MLAYLAVIAREPAAVERALREEERAGVGAPEMVFSRGVRS